jgi:hypothetical protein
MKKHITQFSWLLMVTMLFYGCKEGNEIMVDERLVANISADMQICVSTTVTFNGINSSDAEGDRIAFLWKIRQSLAGSSTTVSGSTLSNAAYFQSYLRRYFTRYACFFKSVYGTFFQLS